MTLNAGQLDSNLNLTAGMAAAIEAAFEGVLPLGPTEDPPVGRRKLALAIARGVLRYIHDNASSIHVTVPNTGTTGVHEQTVTFDIDMSGL